MQWQSHVGSGREVVGMVKERVEHLQWQVAWRVFVVFIFVWSGLRKAWRVESGDGYMYVKGV